MKVLLVEDEDFSIESTSSLLNSTFADLSLTVSRSKQSALEALRSECFDLIVCDLKIPSNDDGLNASEEHGKAVHSTARGLHPGTPQIFLTGFGTAKNTKTELSSGGTAQMYGLPGHPAVQLGQKDDPAEYKKYFREFAEGLELLRNCCHVTLGGEDIDGIAERAMRMYALRIGANSVTEKCFSGKSGARVSRLNLQDSSGRTSSVLMKLSHWEKAFEEIQRYEQFVPNSLNPGFFAPAVTPISHGLRDQAALFYTLADPRSVSLFSLLESQPELAAQMVDKLKDATQSWTTGSTTRLINLADFRRVKTPDNEFDRMSKSVVDLPLFDNRTVEMEFGVNHGDLHGENVLIDTTGRPLLIDFGDTNLGPKGLDPITLELSVLFHSDRPKSSDQWPTERHLSAWTDVNAYSKESPYREFILACRRWAYSVTNAETIHQIAYVHALRQLKYGDTNKDWVKTVVACIARSKNPEQ